MERVVSCNVSVFGALAIVVSRTTDSAILYSPGDLEVKLQMM